MRSQVALIGMRERVRQDYRLVHLRGQEGTIKNRWGHPNYLALDVPLDNSSSELFWHHGLEAIAETD